MTRKKPSKLAAGVFAYIRVSSRSQDYASQLSAIERACKTRGDQLAHVYREKMTAKSIVRPELDKLRADARAGVIRRLYVFRLDRLARSGIRDTLQVVHELRAAGVELVSLTDGFDLQGPASDVVLAVLAWAAQMERLAAGERIANAMRRMKDQGRTWGRTSNMGPAVRAQAQAMRRAGKSIRAIAIALKVPKTTVFRSLEMSSNSSPSTRGSRTSSSSSSSPSSRSSKTSSSSSSSPSTRSSKTSSSSSSSPSSRSSKTSSSSSSSPA